MYRALCYRHYRQLPKAQISEYRKDLWTFHAKGLWAYEDNKPYLTSVGSSNFGKTDVAQRSYRRDTEFQLYLWSDCPSLHRQLQAETEHLWSTSQLVTLQTFSSEFKTGLATRLLARVCSPFL
jgi:CDP-diacylglycerol--glycerol-3-phosphate 3-phosphatidyltransferase